MDVAKRPLFHYGCNIMICRHFPAKGECLFYIIFVFLLLNSVDLMNYNKCSLISELCSLFMENREACLGM